MLIDGLTFSDLIVRINKIMERITSKSYLDVYLIEAFSFITYHYFLILFQNAPIRNRKRYILNEIANFNMNFVKSIAKLTFIQQKDYFALYLNYTSKFNT